MVDKDDADVLPLGDGKVEFNDVHFHYAPERQILNGISFTVEPGQTFALVSYSLLLLLFIVRLCPCDRSYKF